MSLGLDATIGTDIMAFPIALAVSGITAWPIYRLLLAMKSRQTVSQFLGETHQAKQGTPTMGGLIVVVGAALAMYAVSVPLSTVLLFLGFALIGFADDYIVPKLMPGKRGLGWVPKLVMQIAVSSGCLWLGSEFHGASLGMAVFFILFLSNAYNFSDGLDGLAGGLLLVLASGLVAMSAYAPQVASPMLALIGAIIPFLLLNAPPAKVFMGDVGSLSIGAVLGLACSQLVQSFSSSQAMQVTGPIALAFLFFMMIAELVPVPLQILSVKLRKGKRLFPRTPIHHSFELYKWPESRITWTFILVQIICVGLSFVVLSISNEVHIR